MECADSESGQYLAGHGTIEGVELFSSVELDGTNIVNGIEEDIIRIVPMLLLWCW